MSKRSSIHSLLRVDNQRLRAENERLRGLIAQVESDGGRYDRCPWCRGIMLIEHDGHTPDCPAFSARGEVRR